MRTFVGIAIDPAIHEAIAGYMESLEPFAPGERWVRPESLHVTLKFIGEVPDAEVARILASLREVRSGQFDISFRDVGFFPNPRNPRVFWVGVAGGDRLSRLASAVDQAIVAIKPLRIAPEKNPYQPHLTLARSGSGRPYSRPGDRADSGLRILSEKLAQKGAPDFGTMTAREFILYKSELLRGGSRYTKLEHFRLG